MYSSLLSTLLACIWRYALSAFCPCSHVCSLPPCFPPWWTLISLEPQARINSSIHKLLWSWRFSAATIKELMHRETKLKWRKDRSCLYTSPEGVFLFAVSRRWISPVSSQWRHGRTSSYFSTDSRKKHSSLGVGVGYLVLTWTSQPDALLVLKNYLPA